jgi:hypothetical protein
MSPIALQSRWKHIPNEPIPTYGQSWPQRQSDRLKSETDRTRRNSETAIRGRYGTRCVELMPGAEWSATVVSLRALREHVYSDWAIPPGRKYFLLMHSECVYTTYYFIQYKACLSSSNSDCFLLSSLCKLHCLLRIHLPVKDRYWRNHPTSLSVLDDHRAGIQPARKLTYSV